jgi:antitoxin CptB
MAKPVKQSSSARVFVDCRVASLLAMTKKFPYLAPMHSDDELKRLHWRAHHRGTREADMMIGGFFDAHCATWDAGARAWFTQLLEEQDVDIMAWAIGAQPVPEKFAGEQMSAMQRLDYMKIAR